MAILSKKELENITGGWWPVKMGSFYGFYLSDEEETQLELAAMLMLDSLTSFDHSVRQLPSVTVPTKDGISCTYRFRFVVRDDSTVSYVTDVAHVLGKANKPIMREM